MRGPRVGEARGAPGTEGADCDQWTAGAEATAKVRPSARPQDRRTPTMTTLTLRYVRYALSYLSTVAFALN